MPTSPFPLRHAYVTSKDWLARGKVVSTKGGRLVSLWGSDHGNDRLVVSAAYALPDGMELCELAVESGDGATFPDLSPIFPFAGRMQRAIGDLFGIFPSNPADVRPWLNHGRWLEHNFPLRREIVSPQLPVDGAAGSYKFVTVEGDGVHEIPVGPVHAGIIEPGHFRFSIIGEKVLRLEERLGYKHKGIERRFQEMSPANGIRLASRVSGDSTVAYAWAYAMALEAVADCSPPPRAVWLRAMMLERERVANHMGDLGALANDAAFAFGLTQFSRLKEDWLRLNQRLFFHRFMMDRIIPGGVSVDLDDHAILEVTKQCDTTESEVLALRDIYDNHAGLQDRFMMTGQVTPKLAIKLGLCGMAGRASNIAHDIRAVFPVPPYDVLDVHMATRLSGDVAARVSVRFDEILESLRLMRLLLSGLPPRPVSKSMDWSGVTGTGIGWVEGWRGDILVALDVDGNRIKRCHCHDPSWQNWPVLEHAIIGNIVPDFPLINKSFNLTYAGHDC